MIQKITNLLYKYTHRLPQALSAGLRIRTKEFWSDPDPGLWGVGSESRGSSEYPDLYSNLMIFSPRYLLRIFKVGQNNFLPENTDPIFLYG